MGSKKIDKQPKHKLIFYEEAIKKTSSDYRQYLELGKIYVKLNLK